MSKIEKISVKGYKSLENLVDFKLDNLNILIGPNGAGKSNFISVFKLLNNIIIKRLKHFVRQSGGADNLLYFGQKVTDEIGIEIKTKKNGYSCTLIPTEEDLLYFKNEYGYFYGDYADYKESYGEGHVESKLGEVSAGESKVAGYVRKNLHSWRVYHFHDTSSTAKAKLTQNLDEDYRLNPDASNLASFLIYLKNNKKENYKKIVKTIRLAAPFFDDFVLDPFDESSIILRWRHNESDKIFSANAISDGTLRFICLSTMLLQPFLPSVILLDEPELGLHPYAINLLSGLLRSVSKQTQVIVSTQSVTLVNKFQPEEVIITDRINNQTTLSRRTTKELEKWLGEYGMGDLWEKNLVGGRPLS